MSRYEGLDRDAMYSESTQVARNEIGRILRTMIADADRSCADVDRFAEWWPGRCARITKEVPLNEEERSRDARYHATIEDVIEIGRFLGLSPAATLSLLGESLDVMTGESAGLATLRNGDDALAEEELEEIDDLLQSLSKRMAALKRRGHG